MLQINEQDYFMGILGLHILSKWDEVQIHWISQKQAFLSLSKLLTCSEYITFHYNQTELMRKCVSVNKCNTSNTLLSFPFPFFYDNMNYYKDFKLFKVRF